MMRPPSILSSGFSTLSVWVFALAMTTVPIIAQAEEPSRDTTERGTSSGVSRLVILHSYLLSDAKRELLRSSASERRLDIAFIASDSSPDVFDSEDIVLIDIGHASVGDALIEAARLSVLPGNAAYVVVGDDADVARADLPSWNGLPASRGLADEVATRIRRYYRYAGQQNVDSLITRLVDGRLSDASIAMPEPLAWPTQGFYHPDWPEIVVDLQTVIERAKVDARSSFESSERVPVAAIAINANTLKSADTEWADQLIRMLAERGVFAYAFYGPRRSESLDEQMTTLHGDVVPSVLINAAVVFRPKQRGDELNRLGIPVLQLVPSLSRSQEQWRESRDGLPLANLAYYYSSSELAGLIDPMLVMAKDSETGRLRSIEQQLRLVANKADSLVRLQRRSNAEKRIGIFVYNYPRGADHFGASFLNVPRSLTRVLAAMSDAGYQTDVPEESLLVERLQASLATLYSDTALANVTGKDACGVVSLADYQAWFESLPSEISARIVKAWGPPAAAVADDRGFVIPLLRVGNVVVLPQPLRYPQHGADAEDVRRQQVGHRSNIPLNHQYLATYFYLREQLKCDAMVHFGTHGTVEWAPGKQRALSATDDPYLALGDVPQIYPYIMDNLGEATTAKRRGRAVTISHMTPLARPSGFRPGLHAMHDRMHDWEVATAPAVREELQRLLIGDFVEHQLDLDLGWTTEEMEADFEQFIEELHPYLDDVAMSAQPQGLAVFGDVPPPHRRLAMVMQMLRRPLIDALGEDIDEVFLIDGPLVMESRPARWLQLALQDPVAASRLDLRAVDAMKDDRPSNVPNQSAEQTLDEDRLLKLAERARQLYDDLSSNQEMDALLTALDGRHVPAAYGGDPVRSPDSLPTGRNLYGFDPMRVPTEAAWNIGRGVLDNWWKTQTENGLSPQNITFSLWAGETMRHQGVMEAQIFAALGVRPLWDSRGRIKDLELIPASELNHPRFDVTCTVTGSYRDQFPHVVAWINRAVTLAAEAEENGDEALNFVRQRTESLAEALEANGLSSDEAARRARWRVFSGDQGVYGTGLEKATLFTDLWESADAGGGDQEMASLFIDRLGFAYDETLRPAPAQNLFRRQLAIADVAMMSRSSSTYGVLTSDDAFAYLGGLSLAARAAGNGKIRLQVQNLRDVEEVIIEDSRTAIAKELQSRYLHPGWIKAQQAEGYSGTIQALKASQFLWGWQVTDPTSVRDDQWKSMYDVYVADRYRLDIDAWFDQHNPAARTQLLERMVDAMRLGYWSADAAMEQAVLASYQSALKQTPSAIDSPAAANWMRQRVKGVDDNAATIAADPNAATVEPVASTNTAPKPTANVPEVTPVSGQELVEQSAEAVDKPPTQPRTTWGIVGLLAFVFISGGWAEYRRQSRAQ